MPLSTQQAHLQPQDAPTTSALLTAGLNLGVSGLKGMSGLVLPLLAAQGHVDAGGLPQQRKQEATGLAPLLCKPVAPDKPPGSTNSACRPQPAPLAVTDTTAELPPA